MTQADGSQLTLYASGDEFYHWVHDKDGYTIVPLLLPGRQGITQRGKYQSLAEDSEKTI